MLLKSALVALGATAVAAVPSLEVKGNQFVNPSTGNSFQIVGMAYQPGGSAGYDPAHGLDPLSHAEICKRDAAMMQTLGVNTVRVYNLNPDLNHDECASIFNAAGIYMILDVNSPKPNESLNNVEPWTSYHSGYLNRTFAVVEAFKNYPNTLAFFSGNEVIWDKEAAGIVPQYVRSVTRDIKEYVSKHCDRPIPVGYSAADVREILEDSWNYLVCDITSETGPNSQADIFALNSYSWCGDATYQSSGYNTLVDMFKTSSVPVFFSEYGCNEPSPRVFTEVSTIYSDKMMSTFSGGIVYEYSMEENNYGLAKIAQNDEDLELLEDFRTLQDQLANVNFEQVQSQKASSSSSTAPKCSTNLLTTDAFVKNFTMLPLPPGTQKIINNGVSPKPSGKLVDISNWDVSQTVTDVDGSTLSNIAVVPLDDNESNTPGSNEGGNSDGGNNNNDGSNNSGDEDPEDAAPRVTLGLSIAIPVVLALALGA